MPLATMEPEPTWDESAHAATVDALAAAAAEGAVVHVWGGDWCGDCRRELPALAAALRAAGFEADRVHHHEVDREKTGELVEAYDVTLLPTVVIEVDGVVRARFEERAARPAPAALAASLVETAAED